MKKIYISILFVFAVILTVNAQSNLAVVGHPISVTHTLTKGVQPFATDTMWPPSFSPDPLMCDTSLVYYGLQAPNTGYAFGNNSVGETECAQKYYGSGTVTKVLLLYGKTVGGPGTTTAKIYSIDPTKKGPMTATGTSAVVTIASMPATGFVDYTFSSPVTVTTSFACSVVFPTTAGDSVAIASTELGCSTTDTLSWIKLASGWRSVNSAFGDNGELCLFPVVNTAGGIGEYPSSLGLTLLGSSPNPAMNETTVKYSLDHNTDLTILVFDQSGRIVMKSIEKANSGTHALNVDLKALSAGTYYYSIKTNETMLTSQFSVVK